MNELKQSLKVVKSLIVYIPIFAIIGDLVWTKSAVNYLQVVLGLICYPIVYARIMETVTNSQKASWLKLLEDNWWNYIVTTGLFVILLLSSSRLLLYLSNYLSNIEYFGDKIAKIISGMAVNSLTVYVMPLVFMQKQIFSPIATGLATLARNLFSSFPLLLIVILVGAIKIVTLYLIFPISLFINIAPNVVTFFVFGFIQNLFTVSLDFMLFSWAILLLINRDKRVVKESSRAFAM